MSACRSGEETGITISWNGKRAIGITVPDRLVGEVNADSIAQLLTIRLAGQEIAMAGDYQQTHRGIRFEPLVPFTRGRRYTIWLRNRPLCELAIPALEADDKPRLLAIYPSPDTLPANLLKVYFRFSRPMRESQSARYVALLNANGDTLRDVFLDLQPELWNADRTMLTLWLDPGRIKRDLQPNKRLGAPLQLGDHYQLVVSANWPDALGATLASSTTKLFRVSQRDSLSPDPDRWTIHLPKPETTQPLSLAFGEPLDYYLLTETLHVFSDGAAVPGTWQIGRNELVSTFTPTARWTAGQYRLRIENRLEDRSGNNLNRLFDRDLTKTQRPTDGKSYRDVVFTIGN
ncbi:Ig-like domain-containing protein [Fibrella forsythiae]|uniref:Ig-like domain-containing protein n=1 Tax=Fibrella forsythiae TaxID=2817061 RepID=UPI001E2A40F9|nr:Ig-like domain-containing protein [Fibrella forsythiae]